MWLHGFGFPRYRGGLMFWADGIGVREVYNQIAAWHQRYGERWRPSDYLRQLAEAGPAKGAKGAKTDGVVEKTRKAKKILSLATEAAREHKRRTLDAKAATVTRRS